MVNNSNGNPANFNLREDTSISVFHEKGNLANTSNGNLAKFKAPTRMGLAKENRWRMNLQQKKTRDQPYLIWFIVALFVTILQAQSFTSDGRNSVANLHFEIRNQVSEGASRSLLRYCHPPDKKDTIRIAASQLGVVLTAEREESNPK